MKGMLGLVVAGILGVLAIGVNMAYLHNKTKNIDSVAFVGIKPGTTIKTGEIIKKEHLEAVRIPTNRADTLKKFVYLWDDQNTISGTPATKLYRGGELLLLADYRTPPPKLTLQKDEVLHSIDIAHRSPLVEPGDMISFMIPGQQITTVSSPTSPDAPAAPISDPEIHGPFRVAAIGNRIGSRELMRAYKMPVVNENRLGIILKLEPSAGGGERKFQAKGRNLVNAMAKANNRNVHILLHPELDE